MSLHLAVGIMGNAASLLLYAAPMITFRRVVKNKNTEEFSCVPYTLALSNCLLYTWYGFPVVSNGWENFPLVTINSLGILLELSFIILYFLHAPPNQKKKVTILAASVILVFCSAAIISAYMFQDHFLRKTFIGSIGLVASIAMYASPLVVVKQVIQTKSVEFMPFYLSLFSFFASSLWMTYGLLGHDLFLTSPNLVGTPLSIFQLLLYCKYRKHRTAEKPSESDLEKGGQKILVFDNTAGKLPNQQPDQEKEVSVAKPDA